MIARNVDGSGFEKHNGAFITSAECGKMEMFYLCSHTSLINIEFVDFLA
jgi:beta-N-acetylglucosaminidase